MNNLPIKVVPDIGDGRGKGVVARAPIAAEDELIFQELPLVGIQHTRNRMEEGVTVCAHCFRFVGSIERLLSCHDNNDNSLPCTEAFPLPKPVVCQGGCSEAVYCSSECRQAAWARHHLLLCPNATSSSSNNSQAQHTILEFYQHADETNDAFRLAAQVIASTLLEADRIMKATTTPADVALLDAWKPFAMGHKGLWWECVALPDDVPDEEEGQFRQDLQTLANDSLDLFKAALDDRAPELASTFPALLDLRVWGSIMGMFELNNLSIYVASPVPLWAQAVCDSIEDGDLDAQSIAQHTLVNKHGGLEAIMDDEERWACDGNAYYSLQACINHSCVPNAHAFKRDIDRDGAAVILALRPILAGEEITISYIDQDADLEERRQALKDYGFECDCEKCQAQLLAAELLE